MAMTEAETRAAVVRVAQSQVGRHYGIDHSVGLTRVPTPYGQWYGSAWARAYFCAAGWSWCWSQALGEEAARALIGSQTHGGTAPNRRGYIWTVAIWEQHRARRVALSRLKPGDALLYKYPTSGSRNTNVVNHVDLVESNNPAGGYVDCIGFNVENPSAPRGSDQSLGGGVWRRHIWYSNRHVVGGISIAVPDVPQVDTAAWAKVQRALTALGLAELQGTGAYGPATRTAVTLYARGFGYTGPQDDPTTLLTHLEDSMSTLAQLAQQVTDLPAKVLSTRLPTHPLTRAALGVDSLTVAEALDTTARRAWQGWSYAHRALTAATQARDTARASAERLAGLEAVVTELATHAQGVDPEVVRKAVADAVGRYELTLQRIEDTDDTPEEA